MRTEVFREETVKGGGNDDESDCNRTGCTQPRELPEREERRMISNYSGQYLALAAKYV